MLRMTTTLDTATSGVKEVAQVFGGGIREGSLVLIIGEAKSGKSVLSQHIAYGILRAKDSSVAYFTTENKPEDLIAQMDSMSLRAGQDFVTDRLRIYKMAPSDVTQKAGEALQLIVSQISELPRRFNLVIVDSLTPYMTRAKPVDKVGFLQECKELCEKGRSIVLVVDAHILEGKTHFRAHAMSDYYLRLGSKDMMLETGQVDNRVIKILDVTKLAGAERPGQESIQFEIKPNVGIRMLPFVKIRV